MRAVERRSNIESELASDDPPMDLDDMVFSDEKESREVGVTSAERCGPTTTFAGGEQEVARRFLRRGSAQRVRMSLVSER